MIFFVRYSRGNAGHSRERYGWLLKKDDLFVIQLKYPSGPQKIIPTPALASASASAQNKFSLNND